ncbi:uncharacterized protein LOC116169752 [Photinus pyralis]|uniref:Uncharacterized protein n=1 Tax=Photinus pyralis TaxID=7054 RepID=A0A1Y1K7C9_PHOPY|nr:uncharacterized protein LOC116169752 [Photinus pyralis]
MCTPFRGFTLLRGLQRRMQSNESWMKLIEAHEKEYFTKKRVQFLDYVKAEVAKGRTIEDLSAELEREHGQSQSSSLKLSLKEEDCYVTKNKEFMTYAANELKNGKLLDDLITETKERIDNVAR